MVGEFSFWCRRLEVVAERSEEPRGLRGETLLGFNVPLPCAV